MQAFRAFSDNEKDAIDLNGTPHHQMRNDVWEWNDLWERPDYLFAGDGYGIDDYDFGLRIGTGHSWGWAGGLGWQWGW
ncbi:unnamed protein product [Toxocara canis]|uniref:Lipoprotein n=1 Tax=Toxocara canis TaxID=6265 RepID=A0A183UM51_TOXCA|nr:unnamed protein product [Toxocara canis]